MATEYQFPHYNVVINDNSQAVVSTPSVVNGTKMLHVIRSPRGIDGQVVTVNGGLTEFVKRFGMGPFSEYGQPLLNAYAAINTGVVESHVLRVVAKDSKRANLYVYAAYQTDATTGDVKVKFVHATDDSLVTLDNLGQRADELKPIIADYTVTFLFQVTSLGRGAYGNNLSFRITNDTAQDRANTFKNYILDVYENGVSIERHSVCFTPNAITDDSNKFIDNLFTVIENQSDNVTTYTNVEGFNEIIDYYNTTIIDVLTDVEIEAYIAKIGINKNIEETRKLMTLNHDTFDVLLGTNKNLITLVYDPANVVIYKYTLEPSDSTATPPNFLVSELSGVALLSGSEGEFAGADAATAIERAYLDAYAPRMITDVEKAEDAAAGVVRAYDEDIYSTEKYPLHMIVDAAFSDDVKRAIASLAEIRGDCIALLDIGTDIRSKEDILVKAAAIDVATSSRVDSLDVYQGLITDPYSKRIVKVSSTYGLSIIYPQHFDTYGSKHIPLAGGTYGLIADIYKPNSIYPVMDKSVDANLMNQFVDLRLNYAQINPKNIVTRATQTTRQEINSSLSELSSMFLVLDIKRDYTELVAQYGYNFLESSDYARFDRDAEQINAKYRDSQVKSISSTFSGNDADSDVGTLKLVIDLQNKKVIKVAEVTINVNR